MRVHLALWAIAILMAIASISAYLYRPDLAIRVGTAAIAQTLCDEVFISGLDPQRVFTEEIQPDPGYRLLLKRLHYTIDPDRRQVFATWAGHFKGTCSAPKLPVTPATVPVTPANPKLIAALNDAFAEPDHPPYRRVRAIVIMRNGNIVAERYAPGITPETPLLAYSVSKSVINALIGILVHQGKLNLYAPAPVPAWRDQSDPRHAITLDHLLRMTSGLKLEELDTGFDPVSRMLFTEPDMAAYAEKARLKNPPGKMWEYSSGNTLIASAILRRAVGGRREDVLRFAQHELFEPLGMTRVAIDFDQVGTPIGSTRILASARDWAHFGNLYLNDTHHILPPDWVAYSTKPTLDADYGSGFWLHLGSPTNGIPNDAFFASGKFGQRIVIIPSHQLVIVRFGVTIDPPNFDIQGLRRLVSEVVAAIDASS